MKRNLFLIAVLSAVFVLPAVAQDEQKKKQRNRGNNRMVTQFLKQLEPAKLTDVQVAKVKEMAKEANEMMASIRKDAGITAELMKKRTEIAKKMQGSDKKAKDRVAAINKEAGLTEAQAAAFQKANQTRMAFQRKVVGMLSDEQKEKLSERLQKMAKGGQQRAKGKKKSDKQ